MPTSVGSSRKQESSRKTSTSALLSMPKPLTVWITTNWKILKEMGKQTTLFNLYAEYIMQNAVLYEAQAGVKIAGRNINNVRYADDTTLMAESEEELKSLLMKVKEESEKLA